MKMLFYKLQQTMKTAINYVQIFEDYFSLVLQKKKRETQKLQLTSVTVLDEIHSKQKTLNL